MTLQDQNESNHTLYVIHQTVKAVQRDMEMDMLTFTRPTGPSLLIELGNKENKDTQ